MTILLGPRPCLTLLRPTGPNNIQQLTRRTTRRPKRRRRWRMSFTRTIGRYPEGIALDF